MYVFTTYNYVIKGQYITYAQDQKARNTMKYSSLVRDTSTVSVRTWWSNIRSFPLRKELALRLFTLMPTSCAAERSFSEQGFIQGERRNRLKTQDHWLSNVCKIQERWMVAIMHNLITVVQ